MAVVYAVIHNDDAEGYGYKLVGVFPGDERAQEVAGLLNEETPSAPGLPLGYVVELWDWPDVWPLAYPAAGE